MVTVLTKRHWANNEETVKVLENGLTDLLNAQDNLRRNYILLQFDISVPRDLDEDLAERVEGVANRLSFEGKYLVNLDFGGKTAGSKYVDALFSSDPEYIDAAFAGYVRGICCYDQFPLTTVENVEAVRELSDKLRRDDNLFVSGSRDVPVRLAASDYASEVRTIQELYNVFAVMEYNGGTNPFGPVDIPDWVDYNSVTPLYAAFGETTSGMFMVNPDHSDYAKLLREVTDKVDFYTKPGFTVEIMTPVLAGFSGEISTGYVFAVENGFVSDGLCQTQDWDGHRKNIERIFTNIGTTRLAPYFRQAVQNEKYAGMLKDAGANPDYIVEAQRVIMDGINS